MLLVSYQMVLEWNTNISCVKFSVWLWSCGISASQYTSPVAVSKLCTLTPALILLHVQKKKKSICSDQLNIPSCTKRKRKQYLFWPIKYSFMCKKKSICSDKLNTPSCTKKRESICSDWLNIPSCAKKSICSDWLNISSCAKQVSFLTD